MYDKVKLKKRNSEKFTLKKTSKNWQRTLQGVGGREKQSEALKRQGKVRIQYL